MEESKMEVIGKKVIVRARLAGVHAGVVVAVDWVNRVVQLENARRLWRVYTRDSSGSVRDIAANGLKPDGDHSIGAVLKTVTIQEPDGFELAECTDEAMESILAWQTK